MIPSFTAERISAHLLRRHLEVWVFTVHSSMDMACI
jgi:hypothetical protein